MRKITSTTLLLGLLLVGCGRETADVPVRLVGVGYGPDAIGPAPTPYGGVIEYNWFDFAGAALPMGLVGLLSFTGAPDIGDIRPPYAMVYSSVFLFNTKMTSVENTGSVLPAPPTDDACYLFTEPAGPWGSFDLVDAGATVQFVSDDGASKFVLERYPVDYPVEMKGLFTYYSSLSAWKTVPLMSYIAGKSDQVADMEPTELVSANFPFATGMTFTFPGALAPEQAPTATIPVPSTAAPNPAHIFTPSRQEGVRLSWDGPRYDAWGDTIGKSGPQATCLYYEWNAEAKPPVDAVECVPPETRDDDADAQMYTGPWETTDGKVTFEWTTPATAADTGEFVTLNVRFLGIVEEDNPYLQTKMVNYANEEKPESGRAAMACEAQTDAAQWVMDPTLKEDGALLPSMQGDPLHTVAELACRIKDDGEFVLDSTMLEGAMQTAEQYGAGGAVFFFSRQTRTEVELPDAKDNYDNRRPISPVLINARTVEIGRFWFNGQE